MNIWAPLNASAAAPDLPVLFFIYGGRYLAGVPRGMHVGCVVMMWQAAPTSTCTRRPSWPTRPTLWS